MGVDKKIVYPEYLDADTPDEIIKAVRQNALFGARVIKICVDCKPWGYSVDDMKLFVGEAAKAGLKVEGHVQTVDGARRAIEAGIWSIAHDLGLDDSIHKVMAQKGIFRAGTETPISLTGHQTEARLQARRRDAAQRLGEQGPLTFSTDADYYVPGQDARRGGDRVHRDLEGGRHSRARHPQGDDDQRLQVRGDREHARADQAGPGRRPHRRARQSAADHRRAPRRAVRA